MFLKRKCKYCRNFSENNQFDKDGKRPDIGVCKAFSEIIITHKECNSCGRFKLAPGEK